MGGANVDDMGGLLKRHLTSPALALLSAVQETRSADVRVVVVEAEVIPTGWIV